MVSEVIPKQKCTSKKIGRRFTPSTKSCDADDLKRFYDRQYWEKKAHALDQTKSKTALKGYDPSKSWDGLSQANQAFDRLLHCFAVNQPTHQIGIVGARVLDPMERTGPAGIFSTGPGCGEAIEVPPTLEQRDTREIFQRGLGEGQIAVFNEPHLADGMTVSSTDIIAVKVPEFIKRAGPQADQLLMLPKERREIMRLERENQLATRMMRKAAGDKQRLVALMKNRYPTGVLMVDSTRNIESPIYAQTGRELLEREEWKASRQEERRRYLEKRTTFKPRLGFNPLEHSETPTDEDAMQAVHKGALKKMWDRKGRPQPQAQADGGYLAHGPSHDTHSRLFGKEPIYHNPARMQRLIDIYVRGRPYDLILHTELGPCQRATYLQPGLDDQWRDSSGTHPSQQSLERGRNMQGYVEPSWRCTTPLLDPAY